MIIHKEGTVSIILTIIVVVILNLLAHWLTPDNAIIKGLVYLVSAFLIIIILQFFRNPKRNLQVHENTVLAPADGKVVVIEEVQETEYFNDKRLQVSIFMSPINVHVNRYPIAGLVKYVKYHPGLFLVAWHPKSSTDNERTTVVIEHSNKSEVLFRQIAGALARRIVFYCKPGDRAIQGSEFGFIKFGSRVDIILPVTAKVTVGLQQKVRGGETVIATFS